MPGRPPLPEAIRAARTERGLSLRELAARIAVSPATLSAIENGRTGVSVDRLVELADALEVPTELLLGGAASTERPAAPARRMRTSRTKPTGTPTTTAHSAADWREFPALELDPVLAAAIEAFVETGYHGATMRALAARAGVSAPGVYHHYRDKQELLVRALDLTMDEIHWRVRAALAEGDTTVARVGLAVEALALYHTHRRELAFIGASEMRSLEPPNRDRIRASRNAVQHLLDAEIGLGVAAGDFTTAHPRDAGKAIVTMCTSLPQWFRIGGPSTPEQIAAEYAKFALTLLGMR
ncbi:TetR family transcriptional regulator [Rhodococcus tukisamuensis]|uniref:DNA-binding transcriptional regulator, AcrR family n=1 Tax=Rhodococcus tukisamuensis TaxID=168276 RepID=A0A1G6ZIB8_9NOCA|nr:TetR family transcriptional regulator [Rhodococcus tukisamuensis]SDE02152.1 DNA-binding transcriptional regulator, AcrR family [Rhodococcus tukisamuensis]